MQAPQVVLDRHPKYFLNHILRNFDFKVHMEICSDVNDACCDTMMDSMANDFKGEFITVRPLSWKNRFYEINHPNSIDQFIHINIQVMQWRSGTPKILGFAPKKDFTRYIFRSTRRKKCFQELDNEQIHRGPRVTLWKQGSEILNVENITIVTEVGVKECITFWIVKCLVF